MRKESAAGIIVNSNMNEVIFQYHWSAELNTFLSYVHGYDSKSRFARQSWIVFGRC